MLCIVYTVCVRVCVRVRTSSDQERMRASRPSRNIEWKFRISSDMEKIFLTWISLSGGFFDCAAANIGFMYCERGV